MTRAEIIARLNHGWPAAEWSWDGDNYDDLAWLGAGDKPLLAEVEAVELPDGLPLLKAALKARLDADAEVERLRYITGGAGQAMEYQQAAAEADLLLTAVAADPEHEPDPLQYPMLSASVGIDGDTLVDVATTVATMHGQWRVIGSAIRAARLAGKEAIDAAPTAEAAQAAFDAVEWPEA